MRENLALIDQEQNTSTPSYAGIDEVGRGPLAGPVVAACVAFPDGLALHNYTDSKQLSRKKREELVRLIDFQATDWSISYVDHICIDRINIRNATIFAMRLAASKVVAAHYLADGNLELGSDLSHTSIIKGDTKEPCISAASILAKVWRDKLMTECDELYPGFNLKQHVGYPTRDHLKALATLGPSPIHRKSFGPVRMAQGTNKKNSGKLPLPFSQAFVLHRKRLIEPLYWMDRGVLSLSSASS